MTRYTILAVLLTFHCFTITIKAQPDSTRTFTTERPLIYEDAWDLWPYVFLNENGEPDGYNIDLLKLIFKELDIPYNSTRNVMSEQQLRETKPQELINLLKQLSNYDHTILYYGPQSQESLDAVLSKYHQVPSKRMAEAVGKPYLKQTTTQNEVWIAPYDAKNIYRQ